MAFKKLAYFTVLVTTTLILGFAGNAAASCQYHTYTYPNGRMVTCTTCCYGSICNTNCY